MSDKLTFLEHLKTLLGKQLSCCSLAHLIFLSLHPKRTYFQGSPRYWWKWAFRATNRLPRSCSWQVISPCLWTVFAFQSGRGIGRNAGTVFPPVVPYPQPCEQRAVELWSKGKNMHFHHWQWSSKSSVRWSQAENRMQHPCSHRNYLLLQNR